MSYSLPILFFTSLYTISLGNFSIFDIYISIVYEISTICYIVCCTIKNYKAYKCTSIY